MSLVVACDTASLELDDIFRLISGIDVDGNFYIRVVNDETSPVFDLTCRNTASALDILRGALTTNEDGEYALNVTFLEGDDWILATGRWRDEGVWQADKLWISTPI